ncbi:MAG: PBP1A family penicillin-binding protein [Negativicutes bacterium]|nr:PBP1A family penicillin-binding protein [Negativicutes bacterium]
MSTEPKEQAGNKRRVRRKWPTIAVVATVIFVVMITGAGLGFLTASIHTMPSLKGEIRPAASSQIYDINGKLITTIHAVEDRVPVSINNIPKDLQNAFIATEDVRFYDHIGIDPRGILRAVWSTVTNRAISEGASTITQQLARNALLTQDRTLKRKIQEVFLALQIERQFTKTEILEMYLNQIYFGQGAYGVEAAAHVYFGKSVKDLNLAEAAMLAGLPQSPNYYSPLSNLKAAKERQAVVLDQMAKYEYISQAKADQTKAQELKLVPHSTASSSEASYFIDYVSQQLIDKYGADAVYKDGLKIYTSLDLDMQRAAEKAMSQLPVYNTDSRGIKQPQGALVALDPHTGYIKAMVGGRGNDQFNRAVLAERQPGSAFKPFVYLTAIESGMTPATVIDDTPVSFGSWSPINYDGKFHGRVSLRSALEQSLNVVAVKLAQQVSPDKVLYYAQLLGISTLVTSGNTNDRNLAMALGGLTRGVIPLEIVSAYGVLANQGVRAEPVSIIKVVDRNGKVLEQHQPREKAVINERSAYLLTDMMRGVVTHGTGAGANIGRPAAGKTGTTNDYKDAWFVGFTPDLVAGIWMGFDNDGYLAGITGGATPAIIWRDFMTAALANVPARDFPRPSGIVSATISPKDGLLSPDPKAKDAQNEIFIDGTQPTKPSTGGTTNRADQPGDSQSGDKTLPPPPPRPSAPTAPTPPQKPDQPKKN